MRLCGRLTKLEVLPSVRPLVSHVLSLCCQLYQLLSHLYNHKHNQLKSMDTYLGSECITVFNL